jgi:hypothetical protein
MATTPTRDDLASVAYNTSLGMMKKHGMVPPFFIGMTLDKRIIPYKVPNSFMESSQSKDFLCALMAATFTTDRVFRYAYISEIWVHKSDLKASIDDPNHREEIDEHYERIRKEHGFNPSVQAGRDEGLMIVVGDQAGFTQYYYETKRFPAGKFKEFGPVSKMEAYNPDEKGVKTYGESRFGMILLFADAAEAKASGKGPTVN